MQQLAIVNAPGTPDPGHQAEDDMRHRPEPGKKMRDSLFWQMTCPTRSWASRRTCI